MTKGCTVCKSPECEELSTKCFNHDMSTKELSIIMGCTQRTVQTHMKEHYISNLPDNKVFDILERVTDLVLRVEMVLDLAEESNDYVIFLKSVKEIRESLKLLAELEGRLQVGTTVIVNNDSDIRRAGDAILVALEPYPEAKKAVMHALSNVH